MPYTRERHREGARLALENAGDIAREAGILLENARDARVLALSVIGSEEVGKALLHCFAALGLAGNVVADFDKGHWDSPLRNHLFKQLATEMLHAADDELDSYEMAAADDLGLYPPCERTARLLCGCSRTLSDMFQDKRGVKAGRAWFEHIATLLQPFHRPGIPPYETPDDEKMRGFYVDIGRPTGQPQGVRRLDAESMRSGLGSALGVLGYLREALEDREVWGELSEEVELRRSEYESA